MKIVICGGGTAGWLAALMIKKIQPNHDIVIIESSSIPIVGAGEGSTGYLTDIIQGMNFDFGCNEEEFITETGATVKLGIRHENWKHKGHSYYAPIDITDNAVFLWAKKHNYKMHTASRNGYLIENKKSNFYVQGPDINTHSHAYHFDAHLVGKYFKKIVLCCPGVELIDSEVINIEVEEIGIQKLVLSNGNTVTGDLFIDCTGFARILSKSLDQRWISYSNNLPVNTAMPFILKQQPDEIIEPVTIALAQNAGWMWKIPVSDRWGCGYVFDDRFITTEQAQDEIEKYLGQDIEPIRFLKFDTGRLDKVWYKNCLSLGLAAAFAEPLEATSIHSTIVQLTKFIWDYLRDNEEDTNNLGSQATYNKQIGLMYDDFKDFLVLHYQTDRNDSEFWRYVTSGETQTERVSEVLEITKHKLLTNNDFIGFYGYAGAGLWNWILDGLGKIDTSVVNKEFMHFGIDPDVTDFRWNQYCTTMQQECEKMYSNTDLIRKYHHGNTVS